MVKKKTTKEIRAIDRIIKFQIDDGIESITIAGKEALADLEIDNKNNVTLYLNADKDKINELHSLVPFINLAIKEEGVDPDKQKSVTFSQDLTQFALEIADNSKELASLIKSESSIILDLDGLVQKLLEIAGKLAELEAKNLEQDNRLTEIEEKDQEQDNRLTVIEEKDQEQDDRLTEIDVTQEAHASKLKAIEDKNVEQDNRLTATEAKDLEQDNHLTALAEKDIEQDNRLSFLENRGNGCNDYRAEIITTIEPYYEDRKDLYMAEHFETTHNLKCPILTYQPNKYIRDGIIFITIHRYLGETYDGNGIITAMFDESHVSNGDLQQEHIVEMKTIASGNIKIRCELVNYGSPQEFKIYDIPNDSTENYKISITGFIFVPKPVLIPSEPMTE